MLVFVRQESKGRAEAQRIQNGRVDVAAGDGITHPVKFELALPGTDRLRRAGDQGVEIGHAIVDRGRAQAGRRVRRLPAQASAQVAPGLFRLFF